jgi:hypothetical protein
MNNPSHDDGSKKVKNIAAVLFLLVLTFLVGGSYLHQQRAEDEQVASTTSEQP